MVSETASFSQLPLAPQKGMFVFKCQIGTKQKTEEEQLAKVRDRCCSLL